MSMASELLVWGITAHLIADWLLQNDWMSRNKTNPRHPAGYVHAGIHGLAMALVFPVPAALAVAVSHFLIDLRTPVAWWSKLIRQTQPSQPLRVEWTPGQAIQFYREFGLLDIGTEVRIWTHQVFHIAVVALAAGVSA